VKFIQTTPSLNGKYEASHPPSGASVIAAQRTAFPEDTPHLSVRTLFYYSSRYRFGSISPLRWLLGLIFVGGLYGAVMGRWWLTVLLLLLLGTVVTLYHYWRRRDFVRFEPGVAPVIVSQPLLPNEKVPVMVTGFFGVEQKFQRFTWLPGFYRTFATREHALICQVGQRPWAKLSRWPDDDIGLWYVFFSPQTILQIQWGQLFFGADPRPAIRVTHRVTLPTRKRFRTEQVREEKIYIAFENAAIGELIWADLQHDLTIRTA
jgi:hypothetical protein